MTAVLLSGGLDSTTALGLARTRDEPVVAVSVDYGQRHVKELEAARAIAVYYGVPHAVVDAHGLLTGSALLGAADVPDGRYDDESMRVTVVPGRNMLFVALAVASVLPDHDRLLVGVHAGDHPIYPDCRPEFVLALADACRHGYGLTLEAPFLSLDKADIVRTGAALDVPYRLTWSCYKGGDSHCGRCGTCVERIEAFRLADVPDPTTYVDTDFADSVL